MKIARVSPLTGYPGSKGWLVDAMAAQVQRSGMQTFIEPFAGSAVVGLSLLSAGIIKQLVLVEKHPELSSFWRAALTDETFSARVADVPLHRDGPILQKQIGKRTLAINAHDADNRRVVLDILAHPEKDTALACLVKQRCSFGGGLDKQGLVNIGKPVGGYYRGIASWWEKEKLVPRLQNIFALRNQIDFLYEGDAFISLEKFPKAFAYCDPPYVEKGATLYSFSETNPAQLIDLLLKRTAPWVLSYDDCAAVNALAKERSLECYRWQIKTNVHAQKYELLLMPPGQLWRDTQSVQPSLFQ